MDIRGQIGDAPRAIRETLEMGRAEYDSLVRRVRWGDGPLFVLGSGASYPAALLGVYAFQRLLGWPTVASRPANFLAYSASLIRPKSVVLAVSLSGDADQTLEAALQARSRGASLLALTASSNSPLAEAADNVFLVRATDEGGTGPQSELCLHVAMGFLSLVAARALKRHHQKLDELEREYEKLPEHCERVLMRLTDAARSLSSHLQDVSRLILVGGGPYFSAALQAARTLNSLTPLRAGAEEVVDLLEAFGKPLGGDHGVLFLSGSRSRQKKEVRECARALRDAGENLFAITDADDHDLSEAVSLAILLPDLAEMTGSALALLFLQYLTSELLRRAKSSARPTK